jgi:hypothetical protein
MKNFCLGALIIALVLFCCTTAYSNSLQIENGLQWIIASQNQTGSWGNADNSLNPLTTEYFASAAVFETLRVLDQSNTSSYQNGILWLQAQKDDNTAYLAYKIGILQSSGIDIITDLNTLLSYRNSDNGWGGYLKYTNSNFHAVLVLQALNKINYQDQDTISFAIGFLTGNQNLTAASGSIRATTAMST